MVALKKLIGVTILLVFISSRIVELRSYIKSFIYIRGGKKHKLWKLIDGETSLVKGKVIVDRQPYGTEEIIDNDDSIGAYLWRATRPTTYNTVDFKNKTIKGEKKIYESGMEFGEFSIENNSKIINVVPGEKL